MPSTVKEEAEIATTQAVWDVILGGIDRATHPDVGVRRLLVLLADPPPLGVFNIGDSEFLIAALILVPHSFFLQVDLNFSSQHEAVLMPYHTRAVYCPHTGKGSLQVTCDLAVGAVIVDTVEACGTYGAMFRFHCRGDSDASQRHAGCLLCHTPPFYYDWASTSLRPEHVRMRNVTETERIRTNGVGTGAGDHARSVAGVCSCYRA